MERYNTAERIQSFVNMIGGMNIENNAQAEFYARHYFMGEPRMVDEAMNVLARHSVTGWTGDNFIYTDGPFTWRADELILDVTQGGDEFMKWIPTESLEYREESVAHMSWVAPTGFQPATDNYFEYLEDFDNVSDPCDADCMTFDWGAFEYTLHYGKACVCSPVLKTEDFGLRQHRRTPQPVVRGNRAGWNLENDAEWALARTGIGLEQHMNAVLVHGRQGKQQWDGFRTMLTPGYIDSHVVGGGAPIWANPYVVDGSSIENCDTLALLIKELVRKVRWDCMIRNWSLNDGDVAIVLPHEFVNIILDCIACNGMVGCGTAPVQTAADVRAERARIEGKGRGFGLIEVDGRPVPLLPVNYLSVPGVNADGDNVVTGDIMILVRRVNGQNALAQQYLNFDALGDRWRQAMGDRVYTSNGGIFKHSWASSEHGRCAQFCTEVYGRNVVRYMSLQTLITSVSMCVTLPNQYGSPHWWSNNFAPTVDGTTLVPS